MPGKAALAGEKQIISYTILKLFGLDMLEIAVSTNSYSVSWKLAARKTFSVVKENIF